LSKRFAVARLFKDDHAFIRHGIINGDQQASGEAGFSATLQLSHEFLQLLADGEVHKPDFSANFPAKLMQTQLTWADLVLNQEVMDEVNNIVTWLRQAIRN
jgi:hypothetical protein